MPQRPRQIPPVAIGLPDEQHALAREFFERGPQGVPMLEQRPVFQQAVVEPIFLRRPAQTGAASDMFPQQQPMLAGFGRRPGRIERNRRRELRRRLKGIGVGVSACEPTSKLLEHYLSTPDRGDKSRDTPSRPQFIKASTIESPGTNPAP